MKKIVFVIFCLFGSGLIAGAQVFDMVVDVNGSGDHNSIQGAIDAVPDNSSERTLIFVQNGTYYEKVHLPSTKVNVSLIGQSVEGVKLTFDDNYQDGTAAADTYTMLAEGDGFYAENITIENSSGAKGQAIALRTIGDTMVFKNCQFLGFQDTYYAHKNRQYNLNCTVEGATDFIYGDATCVFDDCTINCVKGGSYISAPADTKLVTPLIGDTFLHGLLFNNCNITADDDVSANSYYLGRPWQPNSSSVYIRCVLGDHIRPEGWSTWNDDNHLSADFAEYMNRNADGTLTDVSQRVNWSYQLDSTEVANYYNLGFFFRKNLQRWDPVRITKELAYPEGIELSDNVLSWSSVEEAIGYVIEKNDQLIGFSTGTSFSGTELSGQASDYIVRSVSENGNLSVNGNPITMGVRSNSYTIKLIEKYSNDIIQFTETVDYKIFNISGQLVTSGSSNQVNINSQRDGIYIVYVIDKNGESEIRKLIK